MTGPEHYAKAERLLKPGAMPGYATDSVMAVMMPTPDAIALAQVHATLALAAATALCPPDEHGYVPAKEYGPWNAVAGTKDNAS